MEAKDKKKYQPPKAQVILTPQAVSQPGCGHD